VPVELDKQVKRLLHLTGFRTNIEKSFAIGPFRESCGADFYNGQPCRSVYIHSLKDQDSRISAINRLNLWSAQHEIPLCRTVQKLLSTLPQVNFVPEWEGFTSGIHAPQSIAAPRRASDGTFLYKSLVPARCAIRVEDAGGEVTFSIPNGQKSRILNLEGLIISLLHGSLSRGSIGIRQMTDRHSRWCNARTPNWTSIAQFSDAPDGSGIRVTGPHHCDAGLNRAAWTRAVATNMFG